MNKENDKLNKFKTEEKLKSKKSDNQQLLNSIKNLLKKN